MVRYLTTNGKTDTYSRYEPFTLSPTRQSRYGDGARYRRVNGAFYESIKFDSVDKKPFPYYKTPHSGLDRPAGRFHCKNAWR
jgi:hypothetical protein